MLRTLLDEKNMSLYKLEKTSHVCHATLNDLYNEKTNIDKCSISLLHSISSALNMSMDKMYSILSYDDLSLVTYNDSFDLFKSNICHDLVSRGDKSFLKKCLSNNLVNVYYKKNELLEALYLLSIIDYICEKNDLPVPQEYSSLRETKLNKLFVPKSVYLLLKSKSVKMTELYNESINTFLSHNILEANVYDVR